MICLFGVAATLILTPIHSQITPPPAATLAAGVDQTAQVAAITGAAVFTPGQTGNYLISYYAKVTTAATTSSALGAGTNSGFIVNYTDGTDSVAQSVTLPMFSQTGATVVQATGNVGNTTTSLVYGTALVFAKAGAAMTYSFGYTSLGGTPMAYAIHTRVQGPM